MSWHRDIAEADPAELARNNMPPDGDPTFIIGQWQRACRDYLDVCEQADRDRHIATEAARVGQRVLQAWNWGRGRKMLRAADLVRGTIFERIADTEDGGTR